MTLLIFFFLIQIRLSTNVTDDVDEDPTGNKALWDRGLLNGASQKADFIASFHVGEIVMSLQVQHPTFSLFVSFP
jgi:splicing factor 3B subunit 3